MTSRAANTSPDIRPGLVLNDRYRLRERIAKGASGPVFAATDESTGAPVAVKLLNPVASDELRRRFLRESTVCATIVDPHVVRILGVGTLHPDVPYIVMELLVGRDLRQHLRERGAFPLDLAVEVGVQVCEGLAAVHAQGIVHRDLKPSNLFAVARDDGGVLIKILDFGVSKANDLDDNITETGAFLGTPRFMAPEQVLGARHVDARADVWSLGAILYELLTGRPPYNEKTVPRLLRAIEVGPPPAPSMLRPTLPVEIDPVVLACLEREPAARTANVSEVAAGLLLARP